MKTFHLAALGCPRRGVDSQKIYNYLQSNGLSFTDNYRQADLVVISSCAFNHDREEKSLASVYHYRHAMPKDATLDIAECLSKMNPDHVAGIDNCLCISPRELDSLDNLIHATIPLKDVPEPNLISDFPLYFETMEKENPQSTNRELNRRLDADYDKTRIFTVRLAKGCLGKCAFCAIKFATGKLESKPLPEVMAEFQQGLDRGYDQFLFVAGDTGCYGLDIGTSIIELLSRIFSVNRDFKIILKEFNAQWLVKYYADLAPLLIQHADKIDYIIIPVQSASNAILKRMKRPYQIEDVAKCLTNLKALCPNLKITTHIMAGFPGETEADFQQSVDFIQRFEFYYVDFYGYEDRPNTESSAYDCKVSQDAIDQRLARIKAAQDSVLKRLVN